MTPERLAEIERNPRDTASIAAIPSLLAEIRRLQSEVTKWRRDGYVRAAEDRIAALEAGRRGKSEHIRQQVMSRVNAGESVGVATPSGIVDGREWLSKWRATPPARPDGFDQGRIDQIKAMLTSKPKP